MSLFRSTLTCFCLLMPASAFASPVDILFQTALAPTETQQQLLRDAEAFWESTLTGYQPGISIENVTINIDAYDADGAGGLLAIARPTRTVTRSGFKLPTTGVVDFDINDLDRLEKDGRLFGLLLHEVAHVLGFGTLWMENGLYTDGTGQYTGTHAIRAYQQEFDPFAVSIPVELDGAEVTRDAHWDETWAGGPNELMTGYYDLPLFLSETTVASFRDLGYTTRPPLAVIPLPAGIWLGLGALGMLGAVRASRKGRRPA